jgi:hypothetical protein
MHDDSNIRSLRAGDGLHLVKTEGDVAKGDVERRVAQRRDGEPIMGLVPDIEVAQPDDLDPTVRELPINAETVGMRNQVALLKQEHKDLDESILALEAVPLPDQILIARLKRKKLAVRDKISKLDDKINPDIIA